MAGGQRRDQQLLRIPARGIASKMRVGRTGNIGLASAAQQVSAAISAIGGCSSALIAGPGQPHAVAMPPRHDPSLGRAVRQNERYFSAASKSEYRRAGKEGVRKER